MNAVGAGADGAQRIHRTSFFQVPLVSRVATVFEAVHSADAADEEQTQANRVALKTLAAVLAAGVSCIGVRNFVLACPLKGGSNGSNGGKGGSGGGGGAVERGVAHSREWVLNFLTSQLATTGRKPIGFFAEYFLPLARDCSALAVEKAEVRVAARSFVPARVVTVARLACLR